MQTTTRHLQLTARAYHRVLKLKRTFTDLAGSEAITHTHLAEALQYRLVLDYLQQEISMHKVRRTPHLTI